MVLYHIIQNSDVAKSRVSNSSDSKKSDSGQVGLEFQKVRFGYPKSRVSCTFYSKSYVLFHKVGFGYIPDLEKSGSGRIPENSGTHSITTLDTCEKCRDL